MDGRSLRLFPIPGDAKDTWVSAVEFREGDYEVQDSLYVNFIRNGFLAYLGALQQDKASGDFTQSGKFLEGIKKSQIDNGGTVMLSEAKIRTEIRYNEYDIFKKLFSWYMYASLLMLFLLIFQIFRDKSKGINVTVKTFKYIIIGLAVLHTAGLIARWYISGHAPWSDAYETMIYIAWAVMIFAMVLGRKSDLAFAAATFIAAMFLMIAHWNWLDPFIANLQPVLNSYWLMIHVAIIVGSYGPFAIGMILGVVSLLLMVLTTTKNKEKMLLNIKEITIINEMALTIGLVMLTIGNFLGGMWANESWGRYWGWDPKETWALISIMAYAFIIHMRLVPGLRGRFAFNFASIIGFSFIIFTYFGVNFYLSGLHSYQSGQQVGSLKTIAIAVGIVALLAILAYRKYVRFYKK